MRIEVIEDANSFDGEVWRVEAKTSPDEPVRTTLFCGQDARDRADEYARMLRAAAQTN